MTDTKQQDTAEKVLFVSHYINHELVQEPQQEGRTSSGAPYHITGTGKRIVFMDNTYETSDPTEIEFIRGHKLFADGTIKEVERPKPDSGPVLMEISEAGTRGDVDRLGEIHAEEIQSHKREDVLSAARKAIEILEEKAPAPAGS